MTKTYAIITSKDERIYNYIYHTGLNIAKENNLFIIYDTESLIKRLPIHINDTYIRFATFPYDSKFLFYKNVPYFYTNKVVLSERILLSEYITPEMIQQNFVCLDHIPHEKRTYQMYLDALSQGAYKYLNQMPTQTPEACLIAVQANFNALIAIKNITHELLAEAHKTAQKDSLYNTIYCPWKSLMQQHPYLQQIV